MAIATDRYRLETSFILLQLPSYYAFESQLCSNHVLLCSVKLCSIVAIYMHGVI